MASTVFTQQHVIGIKMFMIHCGILSVGDVFLHSAKVSGRLPVS